MNKLIAVVVLGAILFTAVPAMALEANLEGLNTDQRIWWPLEPRFDVRYPGRTLILDAPGAEAAWWS
ncbi:MAG: hypothetical protein ACRDGN_00390 [bacterium]